MVDDTVQELITKPFLCNGVVNHHCSGHDLRRVLGVGVLGCEEQLEVPLIKFQFLIIKRNEILPSLLDDVLIKNGIDQRI